jgi:poly-gamma-glutamate synthesis protein (capsule biosynthesis protein)
MPMLLSPVLGPRGRSAEIGAADVETMTDKRQAGPARDSLTLFLCGDVMTGRGIDQILSHPSSPEIYESYLTSAEQYIEVAERVSGPIPRPVDPDYVWGDALKTLRESNPDVRIVNLETAVTTSDDHWPGKGIHYRMHPRNLSVLTAAGIDCCVLANNHVMDWGYDGLGDTLSSLSRAGIATAGAGENFDRAAAPAILAPGDAHRILVFSLGHSGSGIGKSWQARQDWPGVWLLHDFSTESVEMIGRRIGSVKRAGDIAVASIHWGGNWGYGIQAEMQRFARELLDHAGVDLIHGHSSHHPRGIEVHNHKLVLYGCGDFINDYEGIRGRENFRGDLRVMYLPELDPVTGELRRLSMHVLQAHKFRLRSANAQDVAWLATELDRESRRLGQTGIAQEGNTLVVRWG